LLTNRKNIYYWKCDRPNAFYALQDMSYKKNILIPENLLYSLLSHHFESTEFSFRLAGGQGNHITYLVSFKGITYFLRIEDGPEGDDYMEIEAKILDEVRTLGVRTPLIFAVDSSREMVPFAYQIMEYMDYPDLNSLYKNGDLNMLEIARIIGENIASWQTIQCPGFGLFDPKILREKQQLKGLHNVYQDYYLLNWDTHLNFLENRSFITEEEKLKLQNVVKEHTSYLQINQGCLVHKDLALWNILGTKYEIKAYIDWDDSISGDPTDDLSLLACFHSGEFVESTLNGYKKICKLPEHFEKRFWLHVLRNMIVKAVIRVGAGYFNRNDDFFLIGTGSSGESLEAITRDRIRKAYSGLTENFKIKDL
jgi:fructosamine-3-kinase